MQLLLRCRFARCKGAKLNSALVDAIRNNSDPSLALDLYEFHTFRPKHLDIALFPTLLCLSGFRARRKGAKLNSAHVDSVRNNSSAGS